MNRQKMIEYLRNVVNLEREKYVQERTIYSMEYQINSLGHPKTFSYPVGPRQEEFDIVDLLKFGCGAGGAIGFLGLFFLNPLKFAAVGFCIGLLIGGLAAGYDYVHNNRINKENYTEAMQIYNRNISADRLRVDVENKKKERLSIMLKQLKAENQHTCNLLEQYYSIGVIYKKYRGFVPMCSIYEYFQAGLCTELTGHEGAYNIYETEVRFGKLNTKLDEISAKIDAIREHQSVLFDAINQGNLLSEKLLREASHQAQQMQFIENNTAIAAYCSAETAREANQIKWLQVFQMTQ